MVSRIHQMSDEEQTGVNLIAKAVCRFEDGEETTYYVSDLTLFEITFISLRPPPIYSIFTTTLWPKGLTALPPLRVRVVAAYVDPKDASKSGFKAVIVDPSEVTGKLLEKALFQLNLIKGNPQKKSRFERRRDPRIETELPVEVETPGGRHTARIVNMSISGAFIQFATRDSPRTLYPKDEILLHLPDGETTEPITLKVQVIHLQIAEDRIGIGVRFVGLSPLVAHRLEGMILQMLANLAPKEFKNWS